MFSMHPEILVMMYSTVCIYFIINISLQMTCFVSPILKTNHLPYIHDFFFTPKQTWIMNVRCKYTNQWLCFFTITFDCLTPDGLSCRHGVKSPLTHSLFIPSFRPCPKTWAYTEAVNKYGLILFLLAIQPPHICFIP